MGILNIFSKRQSRRQPPEVYRYDDLPEPFRVQVVQILMNATLKSDGHRPDIFDGIHQALCREYGTFALSEEAVRGQYRVAVFTFFLGVADVRKALDVIEISFNRILEQYPETLFKVPANTIAALVAAPQIPAMRPVEAVEELNQRFLEHALGYQFENGQIIRIDSGFAHADITVPALQILSDRVYRGANEEFRSAHEHYRHQRYKECLNECLKAFESTIKAIFEKRRWSYPGNASTRGLLEICFERRLIPAYLQSQFTSLRALLESGTPTLRNRLSGHGQGSTIIDVPQYLAHYALRLTASNILFLSEAERDLAGGRGARS